MPVFDLKEICHDRVGRQGADKGSLSASETARVGLTVCLPRIS